MFCPSSKGSYSVLSWLGNDLTCALSWPAQPLAQQGQRPGPGHRARNHGGAHPPTKMSTGARAQVYGAAQKRETQDAWVKYPQTQNTYPLLLLTATKHIRTSYDYGRGGPARLQRLQLRELREPLPTLYSIIIQL